MGITDWFSKKQKINPKNDFINLIKKIINK